MRIRVTKPSQVDPDLFRVVVSCDPNNVRGGSLKAFAVEVTLVVGAPSDMSAYSRFAHELDSALARISEAASVCPVCEEAEAIRTSVLEGP